MDDLRREGFDRARNFYKVKKAQKRFYNGRLPSLSAVVENFNFIFVADFAIDVLGTDSDSPARARFVGAN